MDMFQNVLKAIVEHTTIQNLSLFLGLIGSAGTAINVINSRKNLKLKLYFFNTDKAKKLALAYVQFENHSSSSLLVTDVNLITNGTYLPCQKFPTIAQTIVKKIDGETSVHVTYNLQFPIQLVGCGGTSGYLVFDIPEYKEEYFRHPITLQVSTNRGRSKKYELCPDREHL